MTEEQEFLLDNAMRMLEQLEPEPDEFYLATAKRIVARWKELRDE